MSARTISAGRAAIEVFLNDVKLRQGLRSVQARLRAAGAGMRQLGGTLLAASSAAAIPLAAATRTYAEFSDQMAVVRAVTGATNEEFKRLSAQAKELGRTTSYSASQVAGAEIELGRAGFNPDEIEAATPGVLNLARATSTELPEAANIAGSALRGFGLEADQIGRVSDVLAVAANSSATTLTDLGEAMKYVAPLAAEANEPIESVSAMLGVLANNGIRGSLAGNAIARALKNVSSQAKQEALKEYGVEAVNAEGKLRPLAEIIADLGEATKGLGNAKRLAAFESLFGRGQAAALKLAGSKDDFSALLAQIQNGEGAAKETADAMDNNLGGAFRRVGSAVEGVQIAIGEALAPTVREAAENFATIAGKVASWVEENRPLVAILAKVTAGVAVAGAVLFSLGAAFSLVASSFGAIATGVGFFGAAISAIASPLALVVGGLAAIGVAVYSLYKSGALDGLLASFKGIGAYVGGVFKDLFGELGGIFGEVWDAAKDAFATGDWRTLGTIASAGLEAAFLSISGKIRKIWEDLKLALIEAFAGASIAIYKIWTDTQAKISGALIDAASRDDAVGAAARLVVGFDPRKMREQSRRFQAGASNFKLEEWARLRDEALAKGDAARAEEIGGWIEKEKQRVATGAIYQDVESFDPAAEAKALIADATRTAQAGVGDYWTSLLDSAREDADRRVEEAKAKLENARERLRAKRTAGKIVTSAEKLADVDLSPGGVGRKLGEFLGLAGSAFPKTAAEKTAAALEPARETIADLSGKLTSAGTFSGWNLGGQFSTQGIAREQLKEARKQTAELREIRKLSGRQLVFS